VNYFLTTPIYYVNANPHLGHAYSTIVADVMRRFHLLDGDECLLLTGTDEHGDKIVKAAEARGMLPKSFVDEMSGRFRDLWPTLDISVDRFIRTTDKNHKRSVQAFLQKVHDAGDIYFGEFGGHYCFGCERFYTEKELENGLCPQHLTRPEYIEEKNYFFRMSKYLPWLKEHMERHPDCIRPERYRKEAMAMVESGDLEDLCISRPKSRLTWGIDLPFDDGYVCYVWFDALINYISAIGWPGGGEFDVFWPGEHLVAKDILKPHAIFWPTMLKSAGLPVYRHLNVHGYWLSRDAKMSKSLGNVVSPLDMGRRYGNDAFRYFLLREMHFGSDANFGEDALVQRINADLANDLGNLFNRVLSMAARFLGSVVPPRGEMLPRDTAIADLAKESMENWAQLFRNVQFSQGLESLWVLVRALNKYTDSEAPWALHKAGETKRLGTVMQVLLTAMEKVALLCWPVMPKAATRMLEQLGSRTKPAKGTLAKVMASFAEYPPGTTLAPSSNLFPRQEAPVADAAPAGDASGKKGEHAAPDAGKKGGGQGASPHVVPPDSSGDGATVPVTIEDFKKLDIRIGTIRAAERHPKADRLLRMEIDFGEGRLRQILSGIAEHYDPKTLVGRQVCALLNLPPRKMRDLVSEGMVLTAEGEGGVRLLTVDGPVPDGGVVA
jgi:methionyl-tRNA synthetase